MFHQQKKTPQERQKIYHAFLQNCLNTGNTQFSFLINMQSQRFTHAWHTF